jgi:nitrilase
MMARVAVIQQPPVLLDRCATLERAVQLLAQAAREGATLVVFPESFVPGYPSWIWRLAAGRDAARMAALHARLLEQSVDLEGRATLYNTVAVLGPDGRLLNRHRKLMPSNAERMVHGFGDASGLRVVDTPAGRLGTLICWENYMPLARYALYAQGVELYVAPTYDAGDGWLSTMRHIALEGRCWVIGSGTALRGADLPADFPGREALFPRTEEWINDGDSVVVDPQGRVAAGPLRRELGILYADVDAARVAAARRTLDVAGHYARPDLFELHVRRTPAAPLRWKDEPFGGTREG